MRDLSEFEKHALDIMVKDNPEEPERQVLETLVANICDRGAKISFENKYLWITPINDNPNISNIIANQLVELMVLIEYLENQYLARLYNCGLTGKTPLPKPREDKEPYSVSKEVRFAVYEFYSNHWNDYFYVSDQLKHIVNDNDFKSDNQIYVEEQLAEAKKQTRLAQEQTDNSWIAIIISGIALVASIVLPFFC